MSFKSEFAINIKNKPEWIDGLPFDKQTRDVQQFYLWELKKVREGLTIAGHKIHPWLYWHLNYWNIFQDVKLDNGNVDRINAHPKLRDNEWFINENIIRAEENPKKGLMLLGTRRFAKSVTISSWTMWNAQTKYGGEASANTILGSSTEDLTALTTYMNHGYEHLHPMFKINRTTKDWFGKQGVVFGVKMKNNETDIFSRVQVINLDAGASTANQKTAGGTPVSWVFDEIGKANFKKSWEAAKPSFDTGLGTWRISPWLTGCVCKGTKVYTSTGIIKNIEDIVKEDGILGYNGEGYSVENIPWLQPPKKKECVRIETESGRYIECSTDHPLLVKIDENCSTFVAAGDLKVGQLLHIFDGTLNSYKTKYTKSSLDKGEFFENKELRNLYTSKIDKVKELGEQDVYNLEAGVTHTYLTNGFISHNTSGNVDLVKDAMSLAQNPELHNLLVMDWSLVERNNPNPTWTRKNWAIFVPGQMSLAFPKVESDLAKYLGEKSEELKKIPIEVTDWENASKTLNEDLVKLKRKDPVAYQNRRMFYPLDPDDCFLQDSFNPFPFAEAQQHLQSLTEREDFGKYVDLYTGSDNEYYYSLSDKEIPEFPHKGGNIDAPFMIFEEPPAVGNRDMQNIYCGGLDHYKQDVSDGDSLGAFYIVKRRQNVFDSTRLVACYVSRPNTMEIFNRNVEMLMKMYGAEVLQENADISFQQHLMRKHEAEVWLANGEKFVKRFVNARSVQNNKFGITPNVKNKEYVLGLVIAYCWEVVNEYKEEDGTTHSVLGVTRIKDRMLLEEIINYKTGQNHDRILAFGYALAWAQYLDDVGIMAGNPQIDFEDIEFKRRKAFNNARSSVYNLNRRSSFYS